MAASDPVHNPDRYRLYRMFAVLGSAGTLQQRIAHDQHWLSILLWSVVLAVCLVMAIRDRGDRLQHSPVVSPGEQP